MINQENNSRFMSHALRLAEQRRGFCAPNPAVGAVLVKDGKVIGEGVHWQCGYPHAEAAVLQPLAEAAAGATLYVTLEPCSHYGRTPPCTDLIIRSGVTTVFFGMRDPNPRVSGSGMQILQQAGIVCQQLPSGEIENFYQSYRYWLANQLPWVTAKLAISLDGKIAAAEGAPVQLTGEECRQLTHQQRLRSDAILTTAATIIADNPQLNVRLGNETITKPLYVLDTELRLPLDAKIFHTAQSITVFHQASADGQKQTRLKNMNVKCRQVNVINQRLDLAAVLSIIGGDGCHDLWVEAGGRCFQSFLSQHLAQQIFIYLAPKILGPTAISAFDQPYDLPPAYHLDSRMYGNDTVLHFTVSD